MKNHENRPYMSIPSFILYIAPFKRNDYTVEVLIQRHIVYHIKAKMYIPFRLRKKETRDFSASRNQLHHSVNFYFTVLSEPSQDSSLGQFLFYRPVGTVTGLIKYDEEEHCSKPPYTIEYKK